MGSRPAEGEYSWAVKPVCNRLRDEAIVQFLGVVDIVGAWATDIGGFVSTNPNSPAYRERYIRWFQYGTFCPIFRTHGTHTTNQNELWSYGPEAQKILVAYDKLRYQLMPYIYSVAWKVTSEAYTPMRPLVWIIATTCERRISATSSCSGPPS